MTNCPNCGAPITGPECEYCGTWFPELERTTEAEIKARTKTLADQEYIRWLYEDAISAMRSYANREEI